MTLQPSRAWRLVDKHAQLIFALILAGFVVLSLIYNVAVPAGEGVDEVAHFEYVLYLKDHAALPILSAPAGPDTPLMGYRAPLYYVVAALLVTPLDTSDLGSALVPNPHFVWIEGSGLGNRNVFLHSPTTGGDSVPWRGVVLAIHLLRLLSTAEGVAALVVARSLLNILLRGQAPLVLAAVAATAFEPTFVSRFSIAQTDGMVALAVLLGIWWCARFGAALFRGDRLPSVVVGGIVLGLALVVDETAFALVPVYAFVAGLAAWKTRQWKPTLKTTGRLILLPAVLAGWWYARNLLLYGDVLAQTAVQSLYASFVRSGPDQWGDFVAVVQQLRRTYWGSFGYDQILVDQRVGDALWVLTAIAIPGFLVALWRWRRDAPLVAAWATGIAGIAAFLALFVRWAMETGGGAIDGGFFVGVFPVVAALVVLGLSQLTPANRFIGPVVFAGAVTIFGWAAPFWVIAPAYRPPVVAADGFPASHPYRTVFSDGFTLLDAVVRPTTIRPGDTSAIDLYWEEPEPTSQDIQYRVRVVARDGKTFFDKTFWPAGGGVPTYTWPAAAIYRDTVGVVVPPNVSIGLARVLVSARQSNGDWLDANGAIEVEATRLAIADPHLVVTIPPDATLDGAVFGDGIDLVAYKVVGPLAPGGPLDLTIYWRADRVLAEDATISVQLVDSTGRLVAQHDTEPDSGRAPTSTWSIGAFLVDTNRITLPRTLAAGNYRLTVVLYTRPNLKRLTALSGDADNRLTLTTLRIP